MNVQNQNRILAALAILLLAAAAHAQQNPPTIGYVYPAGGRQGTSFQVTVGGQFLQGVKNAVISGRFVQAKVIEHVPPLPQKQVDELREQVKELQQRKQAALRPARRFEDPASQPASRPVWTDDDEKMLVQIVERLENFARTRVMPAFGDTVTLDVAISRETPPGLREIRLETAGGLTNPMVFCVAALPEVAKPLAKGAARFGISDERPARRIPRPANPADSQTDITLPVVVNGQILAGERDRYHFTARKGRRLVVAVQARRLVPYLADAVPGWFQALVAIYDANGDELACSDHYRFDPDPVLSCEIPADGQYTVEITDALYRGREDFVYRISIGELPFVTSIFPLGGQAGSPTTVQLTGWNLPTTRLVFNGSGKAPGVYPLSDGPESLLRAQPFALDNLPECLEAEPNDDLARAQPVKPPVIVNGRIAVPGEWDVFSFQGRAGDTIVAEVIARRLGSPLDSTVKITDSGGKQLAYNDDFVDKTLGLMTHHADSWLKLKLPADGTYYVHLCDIQRKAGPDYAYRLRISGARPDFDLRVTPSGINARAGETLPLTAYVVRRDGFDGPISLSPKDAPAGFTLSGATVPPGQDQVRFTLTAPRSLPKVPFALVLEGRATIGFGQVIHKAVPADDQMQAFAYRHLVPAEQLQVCPSDRPFPRGDAQVLSQTPVKIPVGGQGMVEVAVPAGPRTGQVQVELSDPPEGIRIQHTTPTRTGLRILLAADAPKAKPGLSGNLIFTAFGERAQPNAPQAPKRRTPLGALPAVPFTVTGKP